MASKAKLSRSTDHEKRGIEVKEQNRAARDQEIRSRAYEIYLERGALPGHEVEDWLQAERELTSDERKLTGSSAAQNG